MLTLTPSNRAGTETVVLHLASGVFVGLDAVATRIWQLLKTPHTFEELRDRLRAEYDMEPGVLESELAEFLEQMQRAGLVGRREEPLA